MSTHVPAHDVDETKFPFPKDDNGIPLNIFLVTVKKTIDSQPDVSRYVIFANSGAEAHQKILDHYDRSDLGPAAFRISVEYARIASGSKGIIELL